MNLLTFEGEMLTPKIITVVYWLMLLGVLFLGLTAMFNLRGGIFNMIVTFFGGLIAMIFGAIWARISCELMIVEFKMNEALQDIRTKTVSS